MLEQYLEYGLLMLVLREGVGSKSKSHQSLA